MPFVKVIKEPKPGSLRTDEVLKVGDVVEMTDDSANRWIRRGVVEVTQAPKGKANELKADSATGGKPGHAG